VAGEIDGFADLAAVLMPRAVLVEIEVGVPVRVEVRTAARRGLRIARVELEVDAAICGRVGLAAPRGQRIPARRPLLAARRGVAARAVVEAATVDAGL